MAEKKKKNSGLMEKIVAFIVDKRKAFYFIYILIAVFCLIGMNMVKVNNTLTDYLDDSTETRQGLDIMDREFTTYATADVMIDNISYDKASKLRDECEKIKGVKEIEFDDTTKHYADASALFSVTFDGGSDDKISEDALNSVTEKLSDYDTYVSAELGDTKANTINKEISVVMVIVVFIIIAVLLFTSRTYMEVPVLLITFAMAALVNKGTNFFFGTISFVSDSVAIVLQLALAIDYAIILIHRYTEERETHDSREAVIIALQKAIPEISGSCLTTISGLAAMTFMHFKIGYDMGIVLMKSIVISILLVFTLMPGLIMSFSKYIDKTHHKSFVPTISVWGNIVIKLKYITTSCFAVLLVVSFFLSNNCPYAYSYSLLSTISKNESQIAQEMIDATFTKTNVIAVIVPTGDYEKEQKLARELGKLKEVDSVTALADTEAKDGYSVGDFLTPRQFSELIDIDIEQANVLYAAYAVSDESYGKIVGGIDEYKVALIDMFDFLYEHSSDGYIDLDDDMQDELDDVHEKLDDGREQLQGKDYSRMVLKLNIPEESKETFAFLDVLRDTAKKYYGKDVYLAGNSTSDFDLSDTFGGDNILISILSVLFVVIILFFTFQSAGLPIILILVIQGSVWMNFSFPLLQHSYMFFLSYLVVSSIQMGANIDYAIVITNRYTELRKTLTPEEATKTALVQSFPTIFTSGSILAAAGTLVGLLSSDAAISSIGIALGRGTVISILLVMLILPQLLLLCDKIIEKTSFKEIIPNKKLKLAGSLITEEKVQGYINDKVGDMLKDIIRDAVASAGLNHTKTGGTKDSSSAANGADDIVNTANGIEMDVGKTDDDSSEKMTEKEDGGNE